MATVNYYLDMRRPKKDGTFPIKINVRHNRKFLISTSFSSLPQNWDGDGYNKYELNYKAKNSAIHALFNKIERLLLRLEDDEKLKSMPDKALKEYIEEELSQKPRSKKVFIDYMDDFMKTKEKANTIITYESTQKKILEYDKACTFESMDKEWLYAFKKHLKDKGLKINSISIHLRNIRAVFNYCMDKGVTSLYPFRKFEIEMEETRKRSLSVEKLIQLRDFECEEYQKKFRDMFMLMFYMIGINSIDLFEAKVIHEERLEYQREKTGKLYSIKIEPEAMEIINKYRGNEYLLDAMEESKGNYRNFVTAMNRGLKLIGNFERKGLGGKKIREALFPELSTYWARHTWATIAHRIGIPKDTISLALGHSFGSKVTDVYINYDLSKIDEANRAVIDFVNNYSVKKENPHGDIKKTPMG